MYDITHFDGKFFSTIKYLLFKPGFLSHEYLRGRRASYLHPIRMYVFTSAFFFLIFFTLNKEETTIKLTETKNTADQVLRKLEKRKKQLETTLNDSPPGLTKPVIQQTLRLVDSDIARMKQDTIYKDSLKSFSVTNFNLVSFSSNETSYKSVADYDSAQKRLPAADRDNFIKRWFARQSIHLGEEYHHDSKAIGSAILAKFKHLFPQMLFVSLPLFAMLLKLVYIRRKNFFYVNHVVFTIHLYCATFIIILIGFLISALPKLWGAASTDWGELFIMLAGMLYWYKSLRNFYGQRRAKTVLKYILVFFLTCIMMLLLFAVFIIFSAMAI